MQAGGYDGEQAHRKVLTGHETERREPDSPDSPDSGERSFLPKNLGGLRDLPNSPRPFGL
jgi:hypothetical protein